MNSERKSHLLVGIVIAVFAAAIWFFQMQLSAAQQKILAETKRVSVFDAQISQLKLKLRHMQPITVPILMYHYVENVTDERDTIRQSLNIPPLIFEAQLDTLKNAGYTPITMDALNDYFENVADLPNHPIILTFDDGYRDFYTDVLPILERRHVPAVLYVASGFLDSTKNYLTRDQLKEIALSPLVEIDAHSVNHPVLSMLPTEIIEYEVATSKQQLEELIGRPVNHFAYPYGAFSPEVVTATSKAGFKTAVTTLEGSVYYYADRFVLPRIRPGRFTDAAFIERITSFATHPYMSQYHYGKETPL